MEGTSKAAMKSGFCESPCSSLQAVLDIKLCQVRVGNGYAVCVAYSIRLIKVSLCHQHTPALTTAAKGLIVLVNEELFLYSGHNLSSRQKLKH